MPDQLTSFRYQIEISGLRDAFFTECSGLEMKVDGPVADSAAARQRHR